MTTNQIVNPALRYYGGKWALAPWIISHFPRHECYVEPFAGGASCLFRKKPSRYEVINDLSRDVITFFKVLRERPKELIRAINLTPYARAELWAAWQLTDDPLEMARRLYVRSWQSFGSGTGKNMTGWRFQRGGGEVATCANAVHSFNATERLYHVAARLKQVQIECADWQVVVKRFDGQNTLFYLDPPYLLSTRNSADANLKGYQHEMTDADHQEMAELLKTLKGMVIVSGYPSTLYDELFDGWECVTRRARTTRTNRTECLWLSPAVTRRRVRTLSLWEAL